MAKEKKEETVITVPMSLRRSSSEAAYQEARMNHDLKPLEDENCVKEWEDWKLVENRFPYDICFEKHDLLIPKRNVGFRQDLTKAELDEMDLIILEYAQPNYDLVFENMMKRRSVMYLFHLHFATYYKSREEMSL